MDEDQVDYGQEEEGQDEREAPAMPPGMMMAAPDQVAPGQMQPPMPMQRPSPRVMSPGAGTSGVMSPQELDNRAFWRKMSYELEGQPLDQAEQALSAALKFQAVRGYQKDLASGKSASEALTRWAPMMFTASKSSNLGQAAQLVRASRPQGPMVRSAGGQLFSVPREGGSATALTPAPMRPARTDPMQLAKYKGLLGQIAKMQEEISNVPSKERAPLQEQLKALQAEAQRMEGGAAPAAPALAAAPSGRARGNEVIRLTKDGRRAVFDSETKKFLRYANQ